jgi:hypothetical protein
VNPQHPLFIGNPMPVQPVIPQQFPGNRMSFPGNQMSTRPIGSRSMSTDQRRDSPGKCCSPVFYVMNTDSVPNIFILGIRNEHDKECDFSIEVRDSEDPPFSRFGVGQCSYLVFISGILDPLPRAIFKAVGPPSRELWKSDLWNLTQHCPRSGPMKGASCVCPRQ